MHLDNSYSPSQKEILENCRTTYKEEGEDSVLDYLSQVASYDFSCPDKCDEWACETYEEYKEEIENE